MIPAVLAAIALAAPTVPQGNLIRNPGAEAGAASPSGETTVPIAEWQTTSTFTVVPYGGGGAPDFFTFPPPSESQRIDGGKNFFAGGFKAGTSTATQTIDISRAAPLVDRNAVSAALSAWLGGYLSQVDPGTVEADFIGVGGSPLRSVRIGPVTPDERNRDLKFVQKSATTDVPALTRTIRVTMTAVQAEGTYDDAYFDNLALQLNGPALTLSRRCLPRHRVTITAAVPLGMKGRSVTFRAGTHTVVDRTAPFTATVSIHVKRLQVSALGAVLVGGATRAAIPGTLAVHCP